MTAENSDGAAARGVGLPLSLVDPRLGSVSLQRGDGVLVARSVLSVRFPRVPLHVHPRQEETMSVLRGRLEVTVGDRSWVLGPGEGVVVAPGVAHAFAPCGPGEVEWVAEFRPPGGQEAFMRDLWAAARAGAVSPSGRLRLRTLAPMARRHFDAVRLARVPAIVQRVVLAALLAAGRVSRARGRG